MRVPIRRATTAAAIAALTATVSVVTAVVATNASAATGCSVSYSVPSQWPGGFQANVNLTNLGDPLTNWTLTWSFTAGQQVTQAWNTQITQSGSTVTARNVSYNGNLGANATTNLGFIGSWNGGNPAPASFALNGVTCTGGPTTTSPARTTAPTTTPTTAPTTTRTTTPTTTPTTTRPSTPPTSGVHTMGFIGCSMAENVAQGYVAVGGTRMWGPYGTGGLVVQNWTDTNSSSWQKFDQQTSQFGKPTAVWVQVCIFASQGATYTEVKQLIANARQHAASGARVFITGQPLYPEGNVCSLAGASGPQLTDSLAKQAAADTTQNVAYPGVFTLKNSEVADGCHANTAGQASLGRQAIAFWG